MGFIFSAGTPLLRAVNPKEVPPCDRCHTGGPGRGVEGEAIFLSAETELLKMSYLRICPELGVDKTQGDSGMKSLPQGLVAAPKKPGPPAGSPRQFLQWGPRAPRTPATGAGGQGEEGPHDRADHMRVCVVCAGRVLCADRWAPRSHSHISRFLGRVGLFFQDCVERTLCVGSAV